MIRILRAKPVGAHKVKLDELRFQELRVEGGTLVWPVEADLCPDFLIWGGLPLAEEGSRVRDLKVTDSWERRRTPEF